jgi:hypothetical protein
MIRTTHLSASRDMRRDWTGEEVPEGRTAGTDPVYRESGNQETFL